MIKIIENKWPIIKGAIWFNFAQILVCQADYHHAQLKVTVKLNVQQCELHILYLKQRQSLC